MGAVRSTAPAAAGASIVATGPRRTSEGVLIPVFFALNSSLVGSIPADVLAEIKTRLSSTPGARASVTGHASSDGDPELNKMLSVRRAEAFKAYLATEGVDAGRIDVLGKGADVPIASNETIDGRAKNRRVEVRF